MSIDIFPPILITGCARSGTSMVAGTVNLCGAFGGIMSGPNKNNAKGMFENIHIRQGITKPYLRKIGVDPLGQFPLPDIKNLLPYATLKNEIHGIIKDEGYLGGPWMYKGAKMCLVWPIMHKAFPDAKWIIVRRNDNDIINSCIETSFMQAFSKPFVQRAIGVSNEYDGWQWWVDQHKKRFEEMKSADLNIMEVWPEQMIHGDYTRIKEVIAWLGLTWNETAKNFIEPKLWRAKEWKDGKKNG